MNKKREDQLVRLAFGDLTPEEAARLQIETAGEPEAAQTLDAYRRMKEELRSLVDVPADQLSKERLREAILARGLSERPVRRQASWLWMPAAAAVLAFGVVFYKGHFGRAANSPVALLGESRGSMVASVPNFKVKMPSSVKPNENIPTDDDILNSFDEESPQTTRHPRHKARNDESPWMDVSDYNLYAAAGHPASASSNSGVSPMTAGPPAPSGGQPEPSPTVMDMATRSMDKKTADSTIILIQPETDNNTGARKATEVESASNVLVGG